MISAKMATPGLLKTFLWNKSYDVIIYVDDFTNKILSRDSNYVVDVFMWPKFGNCSIPQFYKDLTLKTAFFEGCSWFRFNNLGLFWGEILRQCGKRIETKSQKVLGANSYVCRSCRGKTGRGWEGGFLPPPPSWIGLLNQLKKRFYTRQRTPFLRLINCALHRRIF